LLDNLAQHRGNGVHQHGRGFDGDLLVGLTNFHVFIQRANLVGQQRDVFG
jgi:hypothetical protein